MVLLEAELGERLICWWLLSLSSLWSWCCLQGNVSKFSRRVRYSFFMLQGMGSVPRLWIHYIECHTWKRRIREPWSCASSLFSTWVRPTSWESTGGKYCGVCSFFPFLTKADICKVRAFESSPVTQPQGFLRDCFPRGIARVQGAMWGKDVAVNTTDIQREMSR